MISGNLTQEIQRIDRQALREFIDRKWDDEILPALTDYIAVPAKSPMFDLDWAHNGFIEHVITDAVQWAERQTYTRPESGNHPLAQSHARNLFRSTGYTFEQQRHHCSLRPSRQTARVRRLVSDLGPWSPKYEDAKPYGRSGADDSYATYSSISAITALDVQGVERPRCVGIIETCEESGSYDLLPYIDALRDRLGNVSLMICLDSGAGNYDQLWLTTSLRGLIAGDLEVQVLDEGIHSGTNGGIAPSTFRIMRRLLERLEVFEHWQPAAEGFSLRHSVVPAERSGSNGTHSW